MANFKLSDLSKVEKLKNDAMLMIVQDGKNYRTSMTDIVKKASGADFSEIEKRLDTVEKNSESIREISTALESVKGLLGGLTGVVLDPDDDYSDVNDDFEAAKVGATITTSKDTTLEFECSEGRFTQDLEQGKIYMKTETNEVAKLEDGTIVPIIDGALPDGNSVPDTANTIIIAEPIVVIKEINLLPETIDTDLINSMIFDLNW